mmetsp:Transcript_69296/g.144714  ORF Transcript_69296/g.144714 Transcript_69296/m.144714 type:complete len:309 (-) Transcript_69296:220-1146(-)
MAVALHRGHRAWRHRHHRSPGNSGERHVPGSTGQGPGGRPREGLRQGEARPPVLAQHARDLRRGGHLRCAPVRLLRLDPLLLGGPGHLAQRPHGGGHDHSLSADRARPPHRLAQRLGGHRLAHDHQFSTGHGPGPASLVRHRCPPHELDGDQHGLRRGLRTAGGFDWNFVVPLRGRALSHRGEDHEHRPGLQHRFLPLWRPGSRGNDLALQGALDGPRLPLLFCGLRGPRLHAGEPLLAGLPEHPLRARGPLLRRHVRPSQEGPSCQGAAAAEKARQHQRRRQDGHDREPIGERFQRHHGLIDRSQSQ